MFNEDECTIVAAACQDDCVKQLSFKAYKWFNELGSQLIYKLKFWGSFAFVTKIG